MFNNVGKKIESLAKIFLYASIGLCLLAWAVLLILGISYESILLIAIGLAVLVVGIFVSWVESVLLFAFGRLVKNSDLLVDNSDMLVDNTDPVNDANTYDEPFDNLKVKVCPEVIQKRRNRLEKRANSEEVATARNKFKAWVTAIVIAVIVGTTIIAMIIVGLSSPSMQYKKAMNLMDQEKYEQAIEILVELDDYEDSEKQIDKALRTMLQNGDYKKAAELAQKAKVSDRDYYTLVAQGDYNALCRYFMFNELRLNNIPTIPAMEFYNCHTLKKVTITEDTTVIGEKAFAECDSLKTITLPATLTYIHANAFQYCDRLTDIYFMGTQAQWNTITKDNLGLSSSVTIHFKNPSK